MREQSYSNKFQNKQKQIREFRGGETKVMKKRLNILLVFALVFSMLMPAFAAANTAELTTEQKFEALKKAGIMEGNAAGEADLQGDMTRGQLAKVLANLYGLTLLPGEKVPGFNEPTDSEFYQKGYIQAVVKAGYMIGGPKKDGTTGFRPNDKFTVQELAVVLARALDLKLDTNATVEGKTAAWATAAVAAVTKAGLIPPSTDYTVNAKRELLVNGAFEVKAHEDAKNALAINSFKAVGAKKLEVTFSKAVDAEKAQLSVKRGTVAVNADKVEFSADKKSAVITTTTKLTKGDYTLTVTGLTEELTSKVAVEDEKVAKIEILSKKAPRLAADDKKALVNYQVSNQYGEKMTNQTVSWTISTGVAVANEDTAKGTFEITAAGGNDFIPGAIVFITGVHASSGTVVNAQVEIALAAQADKVNFKGVYDKTTSKEVSLPAGFADNRYVLLLEVVDQYGNKMSNPDLSKLVFTSNNPLFVSSDTSLAGGAFAAASDVTIDDVVYKAVDLKPGSSVNNGGSVTIQAISTVTGTSSSYTITAEALAAVKTFSLSAPSKIIAEGETVEIPFTAVDQYGNAVTKFESLDGKVTLSPAFSGGAGLFFEKQNDGSAKLKYTAPATGASDSTDLPVYLTSLVVNGGNFSSLMVNVKETARPTAIIGLNADVAKYVARNNHVEFKAEDLIIQDQHGRTMKKDDVNTWIAASAYNTIEVKSTFAASNDKSPFAVTVGGGSDAGTTSLVAASDVLRLAAKNTDGLTGTESITFTLTKPNAAGNAAEVINASAKSITFNKVEQSAYTKFEIEDLKVMYNNTATISGNDVNTDSKYNKTVKVFGVLANGTKVELPATDFTVSTTGKLDLVGTNVLADILASGNQYTDADFKDNTGTYKDVKVPVLVTVNDNSTGAALSILETELVLSNKAPVATTIKLDGDKVTDGKATINPSLANAITTANLVSFVKEVKDQYGVVDTTTVPTITITNLVKVTDSSFTVVDNGKDTANITGAKLGDKFTATIKYGNVSTKVEFTVGLAK